MVNTLLVSEQIRLRIKLSVAAYAYEFRNDPIMSDEEFDRLAYEVDLSIKTGNRKLDNFFKKHFIPDSGMWIHKHPEKRKLAALYERYYK